MFTSLGIIHVLMLGYRVGLLYFEHWGVINAQLQFCFHLLHHPRLSRQVRAVYSCKGSFNSWIFIQGVSGHLLHHPGRYRQVRAVYSHKGSFNSWIFIQGVSGLTDDIMRYKTGKEIEYNVKFPNKLISYIVSQQLYLLSHFSIFYL